ncbi:DUF1634 domain-containing protein [Candidatus Poribacteria bacterium]|nr:DUF1634 domain-containing protein [Candidatus Poribacteria bacterium]
MRRATTSWSDQQVEEILGNLLRTGVVLAAIVVLVGGFIYLYRHGASAPNYGVFHGEPTGLRTVSGIVTEALSLRGRGLIQLGLILLIATPVARVAFSLFAFVRQKDYTYIAVTMFVLGLLIYSLTGGYL